MGFLVVGKGGKNNREAVLTLLGNQRETSMLFFRSAFLCLLFDIIRYHMISGKLSILMEKSSMLPCSSVAEAASLYSVDSISCVTVSLTSGSCLAIKMHGRSPPNPPFPVGSYSPGFAYV